MQFYFLKSTVSLSALLIFVACEQQYGISATQSNPSFNDNNNSQPQPEARPQPKTQPKVSSKQVQAPRCSSFIASSVDLNKLTDLGRYFFENIKIAEDFADDYDDYNRFAQGPDESQIWHTVSYNTPGGFMISGHPGVNGFSGMPGFENSMVGQLTVARQEGCSLRLSKFKTSLRDSEGALIMTQDEMEFGPYLHVGRNSGTSSFGRLYAYAYPYSLDIGASDPGVAPSAARVRTFAALKNHFNDFASLPRIPAANGIDQIVRVSALMDVCTDLLDTEDCSPQSDSFVARNLIPRITINITKAEFYETLLSLCNAPADDDYRICR